MFENLLENNKEYFVGSYKEFEHPDIWGYTTDKVIKLFEKAITHDDPRAIYKAARLLLLGESKDAERGEELLNQAVERDYALAKSFRSFYDSLTTPITEALLCEVTLDTEDPGLLLLAGQMHLRFTYPVFNQLEYKAVDLGLSLIEKSADMGNIEAVHFLYECYMGYFWQVEWDDEKAKGYLEKYLNMTSDGIEEAILKDFDRLQKEIIKLRRDRRFYTVGRAISKGLPENRGSLDDSYYDKYRK